MEMSFSITYYIISARTTVSLTISLHNPTIPLLTTFPEQVEEAGQHVVRYVKVLAEIAPFTLVWNAV